MLAIPKPTAVTLGSAVNVSIANIFYNITVTFKHVSVFLLYGFCRYFAHFLAFRWLVFFFFRVAPVPARHS